VSCKWFEGLCLVKQSGPVAGGQYGKHMCMQQSDGAQLQTASKQPADLLPLQYRHCGVHEAVMLRAKCIAYGWSLFNNTLFKLCSARWVACVWVVDAVFLRCVEV
jgi:hypothetical protein